METRDLQKEKNPIILLIPSIDHDKSWGFFEGACQGTSGKCEARISLLIAPSHFSLMKYVVWKWTNNHVKLV